MTHFTLPDVNTESSANRACLEKPHFYSGKRVDSILECKSFGAIR